MDESEKAYKEKLRHFFSDDVLETNSISELQEKLKRRQLLFPNAKVNDFIRANIRINDVLDDKKTKTSLSKEEQKEIFKNAPKNVGEEWDRTTLAKSCKTPSIKNTALKSRKYSSASESKMIKDIEESDKNYHYIKSMLTILKGRKRGHEPIDFENNDVFNKVNNKKSGLTNSESELMNEYRKYRKRVSNRKTCKLNYIKRSELPEKELEEIRKKEREYKKIYVDKNRDKLNFKARVRLYLLPEEKKKKIREYKNKQTKKWREANKEIANERAAKWRDENREKVREANRRTYREMPEERKQRLREVRRKWREANQEKIKEYRKEYVKNNRDKVRAANKKFREKNPQHIRDISNRHYSRNKEAIIAKRREKRLLKKQE